MAGRLALARQGPDTFVGETDEGHVFGGLLLGLGLRAAALTVSQGQVASSLHASFVLGGAGGAPVEYSVERTRDGSSFATRRVVARQDGRGVVLVLTAAFHHEEDGPAYEPPAPVDVPPPDGLPVGRYASPWFESRDVPPSGTPPYVRRAWFRPTAPLPPGDDALHLQALAYLSDHGPTRAAREPHAHLADDARRMSVSLDHSVWFHRPAVVDGWLLSELAPAATGRGRGLALGSLRSADGALLATVAQEVLLRQR
jgi:acyl-CoA thioesterase-2